VDEYVFAAIVGLNKSDAQDQSGKAAARPASIFVNPFEQGAIGPDLFRAACDMGLEGLVSKRSDRPYRGGRSPHWIKVKNRQHHAFERVREAEAQ
jgi:ATP-dependent DNA ligase